MVVVIVSVRTCEDVRPWWILFIKHEQTNAWRGREIGKVCKWTDRRIGGKRDECISVMGPRRLHNRTLTEAQTHLKKTPH